MCDRDGVYGGAELWIPTFLFPANWKLPFSAEPIRKQIQVVGFFDYGAGRLRKPLVGEEKNRTLMGTGVGLRVHLFDRVYARVEWGFPVGGSDPVDGRNSAFYFGVTMDLLKDLFK